MNWSGVVSLETTLPAEEESMTCIAVELLT